MIASPRLPASIDMSALSALLAIRSYSEAHDGAPLDEVVEALRRSDADMSAVNFTVGVALHVALGPMPVETPDAFFRGVLSEWVIDQSPWWFRLFPSGRERVLAALKPEEIQCFRASGLLQDPPDPAIALWWDRLADLRRAQEDSELGQQGREAERWSMEREQNRLNALGIKLRPKWMAIENNGAGYDIQSYDPGDVEPVSRLIEVKSSKLTPPRIIITRNEWETAVKFGAAYHFHVWTVPAKEFTELTAAQIAPHIPSDGDKGRWSEVVIPIE